MKKIKQLITAHKILFSVLGVLIGLTTITIWIIASQYRVYQRVDVEASNTTITVNNAGSSNQTQAIESIKYELLNGWNFVSFPLEILSFETAAELIKDIADNGGFATSVATWDGDRWQVYTHSGTDQYGTDFAIEPGKAYFIRSHETYTWTVYGTPLAQIPEIELQAGWNAIGLVGHHNQTAENILDNFNQNKDRAREIDWWQSGSWDVYVKRIYSKDNIRSYGNNFTISPQNGYMMFVVEPGKLEPSL